MVLDGILIAMHANKQTPDKSTPASQKATQAVPAARSMTGLAAWIWIGEVPTALQLTGAAVILAGLSIARLGRSPVRAEALVDCKG